MEAFAHRQPIRRDGALTLLERHRDERVRRFSIKALYLFGSVARDEAMPASEVDALVEFDGSPTFKRFMASSSTWRISSPALSIWSRGER